MITKIKKSINGNRTEKRRKENSIKDKKRKEKKEKTERKTKTENKRKYQTKRKLKTKTQNTRNLYIKITQIKLKWGTITNKEN